MILAQIAPRQYGGFIPPPGYAQFLVERFGIPANARLAPCFVWAAVTVEPFDLKSIPCHHGFGYRIEESSTIELMAAGLKMHPGSPDHVIMVCDCYGRFIE